MPLFQTITDFAQDADVLRRRRYGVIEVAAGRATRIHLRPWPKMISMVEAAWWGQWSHQAMPGDCCRLYYNQPLGSSNFLALKYLYSSHGTRPATVFAAIDLLEQIARLKSTDAIVCEASNPRLSDRMLARHGWQRHTTSRRRNFIKRFYGVYPVPRVKKEAIEN